ncbi:Ras- protein Rab-34 [Clydaea vesicula]|uniref:Ras- protein Rab-34 n=1 Tax=Clydaea vesicula TaxID=447962 RepID=A0AAD5U3S9_9FUNG|nr:Ras- protein Rab-34 [Clydaea vesicula]
MSTEPKKVVVLGSVACGKTALINRAVNNSFSAEYKATFGADLTIKVSNEIKPSTLHIWNCSGHERYRALMEQFIICANVVVLCFDLLKTSSFSELTYWMAPDALVVLVGTKSDNSDDISIQHADALKQAKEWGIEYKAVSAKTGQNVNELFTFIAQAV